MTRAFEKEILETLKALPGDVIKDECLPERTFFFLTARACGMVRILRVYCEYTATLSLISMTIGPIGMPNQCVCAAANGSLWTSLRERMVR